MGLIYVNPEGPNGNPDPLAAARDIRETFGRMAMNDEETVALIAGGHTFGKTHGAADPDELRRPRARGRPARGAGPRLDAAPSAPARAATRSPAASRSPGPPRRPQWDNSFFDILFGYEWELTKSPAGANQWKPKDGAGAGTVPDAHDPSKRTPPTMLTTDLALRFDPVYEPISRRFHENPDEFADAFARAWFKLTHRDMGPIARYLGPEVPTEDADLAGPGARRSTTSSSTRRTSPALKEQILASGLTVSQLVSTAWASASTFRGSDKRGGANGARIRLEPQNGLGGQRPRPSSRRCSRTLEGIQADFDAARRGKRVSLADLIVLAGSAGVEQAARGRRPRRRGAVHARAARTRRRSRPTSSRSPRSSRPRTGSATTCGKGQPAAGRVPAARPGEPADPERARR